MIVLAVCFLAAGSTYAADRKANVTVAKLDGRARVAATMSKTLSKPAAVSPARSTPAVAIESQVCDYSVETDCR
jgi:hypothetical protein